MSICCAYSLSDKLSANVHLVTATDSWVMCVPCAVCETASLIIHHHDLHLLGKFLPQTLEYSLDAVDVIGCDLID